MKEAIRNGVKCQSLNTQMYSTKAKKKWKEKWKKQNKKQKN